MSDTSNYDAGQSLVDFTSHDSQQEPRSFSPPSFPGHTRGNGSQSLVDFTTPDDQWTPRNPEYESPSYLGNLAKLAGERAVNIVGGGVRFIGQSVDQLGDWLEERIPLGKIDIDDTGISWRPFTKEDVEKESPLLGLARNLENAYFGSEDERLTSWEDVKSTPFSSVLPFAFEQGIISSPDMVAALTNLPAYVAARTGEMGQERARNDAKRDATLGDFLKVAPAAVGSALLERIGASGMLGLGDVAVQGAKQIPGAVAKAGVKEAGTEALQEFGESVATTAGTKEGFDLSQSLERAAQGAVAGGPFGAGVRGGTATFEAIRNRGRAQTPPAGPSVDGDVTSGDVPEGAVPAEDLIGEVEEPPVAPPKRTAPITPDDEASPLSSDKIARGKAIIDDAVAGRPLDIGEAPRSVIDKRPQEVPEPVTAPRQFPERPVASREGARETTLNYQGAVPAVPFQPSSSVAPASPVEAAPTPQESTPPLPAAGDAGQPVSAPIAAVLPPPQAAGPASVAAGAGQPAAPASPEFPTASPDQAATPTIAAPLPEKDPAAPVAGSVQADVPVTPELPQAAPIQAGEGTTTPDIAEGQQAPDTPTPAPAPAPSQAPSAQAAPEAPPSAAPALQVRDHGSKSIIVTGQTWKNRKRIGNATGHKPLWNKKAKGFIFPKKREKEVREALDDLLAPTPVPAVAPRPDEALPAPADEATAPQAETQMRSDNAAAEGDGPLGGGSESTYGRDNKIISTDRAALARERLRKKLSQVNTGIDPEIMAEGAILAVFHVEAGARKFPDFARAVLDDLGNAARPFLKLWYNAARDYPGMMSGDMTPYEDVATFDVDENIDREEISENGVQGTVSAGDARSSPENVQSAAKDRGDGISPKEKVSGSAPVVRAVDEGRAEDEKRDSDAAAPDRSRATSSGDPDRVPDVRRADDRQIKGENFYIEDGALQESRGFKQKAKDNIRAIELLGEIESEDRPATKEEQKQLALYVGWGGIKGAFPDANGKFAKGYEGIGKKVKELLSDEEYATAERSIQYAHYTSDSIVRAMWRAAERLGFDGGKVFEPGMGTGNFAGMMPPDIAAISDYNGMELDYTTSRIARLLYPEWGVQQGDFTKAPLPENTYDLVIGNPPFADIAVKSDPKYASRNFLLHDYFFAKSLDAVRPGGLLMFITSAGTMNKINSNAREYLADRADLVAAIRLPGNAFQQNAGTSVTTDIVILRKRLPNESAGDRSWTSTGAVTLPNKDGIPTEGASNAYFISNPEMILGEEGFFDKLYEGRYAVRAEPGADIEAQLDKAVSDLPSNVMSKWQDTNTRAHFDFNTKERKQGSFYLDDKGDLMQFIGGVGKPVHKRGKGVKGGKTLAEIQRIKAFIPVRDALREVYAADLDRDGERASKARERLNKSYDSFVEKFGPINTATYQYRRPTVVQQEQARSQAREEARYSGLPWDEGDFDAAPLYDAGKSVSEIARERKRAREAGGKLFNEGSFDPSDIPDIVVVKRPNADAFIDDPESYRIRSIEEYDIETGKSSKGFVFEGNVIAREVTPEINSIEDALLYSINQTGRVDINLIAGKMDIGPKEAVEKLADRIFREPGRSESYVTRDEYLSGNVRKKLLEAQAAAARDPDFRQNVIALEAVQPSPIPYTDISANLGMPWIPTDVIERFGTEGLGLDGLKVTYSPVIAEWTVRGDSSSVAAISTWGTPDIKAPKLISSALNRQDPKVFRKIHSNGKETTEVDAVATQAANEKVRAIKEKFSEWVWSDPAQRDSLAQLYNEEFNNIVVRDFDGSYLTTPGVSSSWKWRPHQKSVIARIIQTGNTYMAHSVGAGKTSAMIGAGMEMRRLGIVRKPMYVVPNHMLGQFTKEFYEQYPTARIMVADERRFHTDRRKQFIADISTEDLDAVIITHSAFGMIPISDDFQDSLIRKQVNEYRKSIEEIKNDKDQGRSRSRMQKQIERLEQTLSGRGNKAKDQVFTFEETGVDFLFVDEAHLFRKLDFATKMSNVKGISPQGSGQSWDLFVKTRYLETVNPGHNLVLASGTPVTNTMAELFSVSRYLQEEELRERGLSHFDSWAGAFGDTVTQLEQDPSGGYKPVTRFAKFVNVPELSAMVRQIMDVVTSRQLEQYVTRPALKGGNRVMNLAEKSDELEDYQSSLADRMKAIAKRKGPPEPGDDIILSVINDGRHAAIDMRLVGGVNDIDHPSKLEILIDNVSDIANKTTLQPFHNPGQNGFSEKPVDKGPATQMVFANLGISGQRGLAVHKYIKSEVVRRSGLKNDEVAIISDFKTHVARQRLFNDMNEGKVRLLIGSTSKMATGVNAQRRLYAVHNLDPLWYPADDEQRNGRILRQGNMNPEIEIHDYSTKGTYDSTMWGMMETKARFIQGFFEADPSMRDMDDLGEASQYEQAKALSTNDPRIMHLTEMKQKLERARRRKTAFDREQSLIKERIARAERIVDVYGNRLDGIKKDIKQRTDISGDAFQGEVGGLNYDDRTEFGGALLAEVGKLKQDGRKVDNAPVAKLGGFEINADIYQLDQNWLAELFISRNNGEVSEVKIGTSARGMTTKLENILMKFEENKSYYEIKISESRDIIERFTPELGNTFKDNKAIEDIQGKVNHLENELAAESEVEPGEDTKFQPAYYDPVAKRIDSEKEFGKDATFRQVRIKVRTFLRGLAVSGRTVRNSDSGFDIGFNMRGAKKSERGGEDLLKAALAIPELLKTGRYLGSESPTSKERWVERVHKFTGAVEIDGKRLDVLLNVMEDQNGKYHYAINEDTGAVESITGLSRGGPEGRRSSVGRDDASDQNVTPKDGGDKLQAADDGNRSFTHQGTRYVLTPDMDARAAEVESEIDDIVKSVNPGAKVKVVDRIEDAERGAALGASAAMTGTGPVILVAMRYRDRDGNLRENPDVSRTLNHEVIHDLRRRGLFTKTEEMLLFRGKANRDWQSRFGGDGRYDSYTDADTRAEEAAADAYAAYQTGDMKPSGPISAAFRKVTQFFERLSNWLQRNGFQSAEDVVRRVEAGKVGRREETQGRTGDSGTRFSLGTPPDGDPGTTAKGGAEVRKSMMMQLIGLQPLDRIIRLPFNFMGGINDQGEWVANRWVSKNAARIIKEAKFDDNGRMSWMNPLLENARMGLSGRLGLTPEYVQRDRQRELDERKIMAEIPELMKMLKGKGIGLSEAKVLQAVLTGEQVPDAEMEKLSEPIRNAIDQLGQEAVELGLLSRESYERNRGSYLHRVYMKHEADQNGLLSWISKMARGSRKKIVGNQFKGRGMFLRVKPGTVVRDTKEFKDRAKDNKRLSWLEKRRDNLLKRLDVAVVQSDERSSEALEHLARRFDLRDRVEKAKRRKVDGAETAPTKGQQARAQEQGVSLNRLRRKSEQAHAVIQKIEAQLLDVQSEIGSIEDRISSEGDVGPTKGQRFNIYDKISDKTGKVAHRVYIPVGTPLPDRYSGYESRGTWEVRSDEATKGKIILWRDFTKKERTDMGEILDARYTIAKTYMGMAHDLATGRFYRDIAENPEWATETEPDKGTWIEASGVNRFWQKDQDIEWVHVPDTKIAKSNTKRYGALAGKYVRIEIWRDLNEIDIMQNPTWWNTLLTQWKLNKTARSPVVHMNNVMSNMMLMDLADVRVADLIVGIRSMLKKDKVYQEAIDNGVFGADMMSVEIRNNILKPALEEIEREMQGGQGSIQGRMGALGKLLDRIWRGAKWLDQKGIDAYQFEDEVFRMATYIRKRELGMPVDLAAQEAREQFLDYDIRAPWVNAARRSVLPFISYTYRAVPVIAQSIVKRPWKLVKYWLVFQALNALVYDFLGDEADEDEERATLREQEQGTLWLTGMDRMMRMPWNDEYDNPVFLDARRWVPAGDLFDIGQANSAIPIPPALMPGGPVMLAAEVILNKSAFTGREIRNVYTDDPADMGRKVAGHLWKSWLPSAPWIPGSWYWEKVGDAMKGARDWQGRPYSLPQALSSSVGVKVRPHDVDAARGFRLRDLQREHRELVAEARRARSDLNRERIDLDEYNDQIDRIRDKLNRVKEKAVALNSTGRK